MAIIRVIGQLEEMKSIGLPCSSIELPYLDIIWQSDNCRRWRATWQFPITLSSTSLHLAQPRHPCSCNPPSCQVTTCCHPTHAFSCSSKYQAIETLHYALHSMQMSLWKMGNWGFKPDSHHSPPFLEVQLFHTEIFGDCQLCSFTFNLYLGTH